MAKFQKFFSERNNDSTQVSLEWKNLNYSVRIKDSKQSKFMKPVYNNQKILDDISGKAISGELLAIMGPTGCGKTSLLNTLAARVPNGGSKNAMLTGRITVNNVDRVDSKFRKISAYVLQDDKLYPQMTVNETLMLAAHFYLPTETSDETKQELVTNVITELGLIKARDTPIGNEKKRGVSGGERKRCNIAVQLISNPQILFLDEPTSGLDSFQALSVMDSMKNMAKNGRLVISVIHQPRSSIFEMFDKLLLLSSGRIMFSGVASDAQSWFTSQGFPCPKLFNPSDFFLDILSPDNRTADLDALTQARIKMLGDNWSAHCSDEASAEEVTTPTDAVESKLESKSEDHKADESVIPNEETPFQTNILVATSASPTPVTESSLFQYDFKRLLKNFKLLAWRSFSEVIRDKTTIFAKIFVTIFFACIVGAMYNNIGYNQTAIYNREGLLFIVAINQSFNSVLGVISTFPREKVIVNRERAANAYDALSYFLAKFVTELPLNMLPPVLWACVVYYIVGLNPNTFGYFILIVMLLSLTGVSLGLWISAMTPNAEAAAALGPPMVIVALIFGGFYINLNSIPIVANWFPYMSLVRWGFEALCINEFKGETFTCGGSTTGYCITSGDQVLDGLSFGGKPTSYAVFGLGMLLLAFVTLAYFFLYISKSSFLPLGWVGANQKRTKV